MNFTVVVVLSIIISPLGSCFTLIVLKSFFYIAEKRELLDDLHTKFLWRVLAFSFI